ncbi:HNH endonuclease signature motif containing protein [Rhizohabitans arisaemae]|uniref:HNH endonuclease signature motif containing protein n=1 Tax=Rhizohabitans arisaemae TaxID=2720610 RepID=UPI0024B24DC9|nr:HNH endonuclease signature motif containing protein [Rhizohabitans arisaemae]
MTQRVPAGLAQMPPGPELALALSRIDEATVSAADAVEVLKAWHRQRAHDEARFMAVTVEVGLRSPGPDSRVCRMEAPDEFSADELRPALAWSRSRAASRLSEAWDLMSRLPVVHAALQRGVIDEVKARAFASWTRGLTVDQARSVCGRLLAVAGVLTVGELIEAIRWAALAIDSEWAERRCAAAVRERRVVGSRNPDGTANLSGLDQPLERVAAACNRVDALARRSKAAGDRRLTQHIRSELFLGLLDGGFQGWTDEEIVAFLVAESQAAQAGTQDGSTPTSPPRQADTPICGEEPRRSVDADGFDRSGVLAGGAPLDPGRSADLKASEVTLDSSGQIASALADGLDGGTGAAQHNRCAVVARKTRSTDPDVAPGRCDDAGSPVGVQRSSGSKGWVPSDFAGEFDDGTGGAQADRRAVVAAQARSAGRGGVAGRCGSSTTPVGVRRPAGRRTDTDLGTPMAGPIESAVAVPDVSSPLGGGGRHHMPMETSTGPGVARSVGATAELPTVPGWAGEGYDVDIGTAIGDRYGVGRLRVGDEVVNTRDVAPPPHKVGGSADAVRADLDAAATVGPQLIEDAWSVGDETGSPQRWAAGELRVEATTLLGLDEHPGELAGWGPVPSGQARRIALRQGKAVWRWVLTDDEGRLVDCGVTRHRPVVGGEPGTTPAVKVRAEITGRVGSASQDLINAVPATDIGTSATKAVSLPGDTASFPGEDGRVGPGSGNMTSTGTATGMRTKIATSIADPVRNSARLGTKIVNTPVRARGVVEVQITASDLPRLSGLPGLPIGWRRILDEITQRAVAHEQFHWDISDLGDQDPKHRWADADVGSSDSTQTVACVDETGSGHGAGRRLKPQTGRSSVDPHCAPDLGSLGSSDHGVDLGRRLPGSALRRFVQVRDRVCTAPGCQVPAAHTDQDHIEEWSMGGPTVATNLHSVCRHDHRLRHEGGWQITRTPAGTVVWITRLGQVCPVPPSPTSIPLPEPAPRRTILPDYPIQDDDTPTFTAAEAHFGSAAFGVWRLTSLDEADLDESEMPPF